MKINGYDTEPQRRGRGGKSSKASAETFHSRVEPTLGERQRQWLDALKSFPGGRATNKQVAERMGRAFNEVSGRASELRGLGLVRYTGVKTADGEILEAVAVDEVGQSSLFQEVA